MLKQTITYTDYNGNERTEDFYFNLSKAECVEWETSVVGGLSNLLESVVKSNNGPQIMKIFKEIIVRSYGKKSADGLRFEKSEEITNAFLQTEAYSELFMKLCTDDKAASDFVNGILPKDAVKNSTQNSITH